MVYVFEEEIYKEVVFISQIKLTTPFAKRKKAGIHKKIGGRVKNIEIININAANKSTMERTSPIKMKRPLTNNSPAGKRRN